MAKQTIIYGYRERDSGHEIVSENPTMLARLLLGDEPFSGGSAYFGKLRLSDNEYHKSATRLREYLADQLNHSLPDVVYCEHRVFRYFVREVVS